MSVRSILLQVPPWAPLSRQRLPLLAIRLRRVHPGLPPQVIPCQASLRTQAKLSHGPETTSFTGQTATWRGMSAQVMDKHLTRLPDTRCGGSGTFRC